MPNLHTFLISIRRQCVRYLHALFKNSGLHNNTIGCEQSHSIMGKLRQTLQHPVWHATELRHQNEYFEALVRTSPIAIVTLDLDFQIVSWNPAAEHLFGYTCDEVLHRAIADVIASDEPKYSECIRHWQQLSAGAHLVQAVTQRTCKDGTSVDVEMRAVPVMVGAAWVGVIVTYYDVSELLQARRKAEDASKAKSMFLASMSHELRTPLNAIMGFAQMIYSSTTVSIEHRHYINIIHRSGEHLLTLINNVLDLSKIEVGHMTLNSIYFDLYLLLNDVEDMFALRAVEQNLLLILERHPDVPQYIYADSAKLRQVLINLLSNAIKFTEKGCVILRVTQSNADSLLHFEVTDTGAGIALEELDTLFEPFTQTQTGRQSQKGTGLGLAISRRFVQLMGGDIHVHSQVGQGTIFSFNLPVLVAESADLIPTLADRQVIGLQPDQPAYRILVVDDTMETRLLLTTLLKPLGFDIREAANGSEACAIWERWNPHLIWMDMRMPVMDGYEATRRIKTTPKGKSTVVIAMTASSFEEERALVLATGCDDFLRKPFHAVDILTLMQKHMGMRYTYAQLEAEDPTMAAPDGRLLPGPEGDLPVPDAHIAIPTELIEQLYQATMRSDMTTIDDLIVQIRTYDSTLAVALKRFANGFAYDQMLNLIDEARGKHG